MIASFILLGIGIVLLCLFLIDKCHKYSVRATFIKTLVSVCFIGVGICSWFYSSKISMNIFGVFVIMGLIFGLLGDMLLDYKYVFKEEDRIFTKLGFLVFGIGHLLYITGMILSFYNMNDKLIFMYVDKLRPIYIWMPFICAIIFVLAVILLEKPMKNNYGKMKPVVLAYSYILALMLSMAGSLAIMYKFNNWTLNFMFIGGILFVISDLILSGTYFSEGKERPVDIITNTVTYYAAQFFIAFSLLMLIF